MNSTCLKCDTRCRLKLCDGKQDEFKYCFRRGGTTYNLEESITPFNTLDELFSTKFFTDTLFEYDRQSLELRPYSYNMRLLVGRFLAEDTTHVIGYVTIPC